MEHSRFSWRARLRSFMYAFDGLIWFFRREHNAWIHGAAVISVSVLSYIFKISGWHLVAIVFAVVIVLITEMFNTVIEKIMDHLSPDPHPSVKIVKDVAAGAVLVSSVAAVIIGLIVFIPEII